MNLNRFMVIALLLTAPLLASEDEVKPEPVQQQPSLEDVQNRQKEALIKQLLQGSSEEQQLALFLTDSVNNQPPQIYYELRKVYFELLAQGVIKGAPEEEKLAQNYCAARQEMQHLNKDAQNIEGQIKTDKSVRIACQAFNLGWTCYKGGFSSKENTFDTKKDLDSITNPWCDKGTNAAKQRSSIEATFKNIGRIEILWNLFKGRVLLPKFRTTSYAPWESFAGSVEKVLVSLAKDQVTPEGQMLTSKAARAGMADPLLTTFKTGLDWFTAYEGHQKLACEKQSALDQILKEKGALVASAKEAKAAVLQELDQNPQKLIPHLSTLVNVMMRSQQPQR